MEVRPLYIYTRADGFTSASPILPTEVADFRESVRLIASEGKALTKDGENTTECVDLDFIDELSLWYEVDYVEPTTPPPEWPADEDAEDMREALRILGVI